MGKDNSVARDSEWRIYKYRFKSCLSCLSQDKIIYLKEDSNMGITCKMTSIKGTLRKLSNGQGAGKQKIKKKTEKKEVKKTK